jgi:hypothetical protein
MAGPDEPVHWQAAQQRAMRVWGDPASCSLAFGLADFVEVGRIAFQPEQKLAPGLFARLGALSEKCPEPALIYGSVLSYPVVLALRPLVGDGSPEQVLFFFYLARALQAALVVAALWRTVVLVRRPGALTLALFCCSPLFAQQSTAVSADAVCLIASLGLCCLVLAWDEIAIGDGAWIATSMLAATFTKPLMVALFLPALLLALPAGVLQAPRRMWMVLDPTRRALLVVALLLTLLGPAWLLIGPATPTASWIAGVDPAAQRAWIAAHPLTALGTLLAAVQREINLSHLIGPLGWVDTPLIRPAARWFELLFKLVIVAEAAWALSRLRFRDLATLPWARGLLLFGGLVAYAVLAALAMFLYFTPVGAGAVQGLQARYLFPIVLLAIAGVGRLVAAGPNVRPPFSPLAAFAAGGALLVETVMVMFSIAVRYW